MNRPRKLPLDDPRWLPLDVPHRWLTECTGNHELAAADLTKLLATPPPRGVRSMVRLWPGEERKLLPFSHWTEHSVTWFKNRLEVSPPHRWFPFGPEGPIHEDVYYAWEPDLKKFRPKRVASVTSSEPASEMPARRGQPMKHDWVAVAVEITRQVYREHKGKVPKTDLPTAKAMQQWCLDQGKSEPVISEMRAIVKAVFDQLRRANK
jgi:hypothetical protein